MEDSLAFVSCTLRDREPLGIKRGHAGNTAAIFEEGDQISADIHEGFSGQGERLWAALLMALFQRAVSVSLVENSLQMTFCNGIDPHLSKGGEKITVSGVGCFLSAGGNRCALRYRVGPVKIIRPELIYPLPGTDIIIQPSIGFCVCLPLALFAGNRRGEGFPNIVFLHLDLPARVFLKPDSGVSLFAHPSGCGWKAVCRDR